MTGPSDTIKPVWATVVRASPPMKKSWLRVTPLRPRPTINLHCRRSDGRAGLSCPARNASSRNASRKTSAAPSARNWASAKGPNPRSAFFPATMLAAQQTVASSIRKCIEA